MFDDGKENNKTKMKAVAVLVEKNNSSMDKFVPLENLPLNLVILHHPRRKTNRKSRLNAFSLPVEFHYRNDEAEKDHHVRMSSDSHLVFVVIFLILHDDFETKPFGVF